MSGPSAFRLRLAVRHLHAGGILAYPTEAVWGLGCDPLNRYAVARLLRLKQRRPDKGLILIAAEFGQIEPFLDLGQPGLRERLLASWPGPVTWVVPAGPRTPAWLRGEGNTLAVRVSAHPVSAALCRLFGGAIVSTSANPSGHPPATNLLGTRRYFAADDLRYLPGATGGLHRPTAIFDAKNGARIR